jgi:hypothetical protein
MNYGIEAEAIDESLFMSSIRGIRGAKKCDDFFKGITSESS